MRQHRTVVSDEAWAWMEPLLPSSAGELEWLVAADSTMVRVHQHGATARRLRGNAATAEADQEGDRRP